MTALMIYGGGHLFNDYPDVLSPKLVAKALNVSVNSVYRLINNGELGYKRMGRKILVPKVCLKDYINSARYTVKM